jgi:flavin-dependent dehydrogenase
MRSRYDVVVIGGGTGGTAAAIAAARHGLTVLLTEETGWLGGQFLRTSTLGLSSSAAPRCIGSIVTGFDRRIATRIR